MMTFDPVFPTTLVALLLGGAAVLACYREFRPGARVVRPGWLKWPALFCRLGALAALAWLFLNPSLVHEQAVPASRPLILIDGSDSMKLRSEGGATRWEDGVDFSKEMKSGLDSAEVRVFSGFVSEAVDLEGGQMLETGGLTLLGSAVERVLAPASEIYDPVMIISDGRAIDRNDLGNALALAQSRGVTLGAHVVGDETLPRNAAITSVIAPETIRPLARIGVKVLLEVNGFEDDEMLTLEVRDSQGAVVATSEVPANLRAPVLLNIDSQLSGQTYRLELKQSGAEEISVADNFHTFEVEIAVRKIRVLMVEGTHVKRSVGDQGHWWNDLRLLTDAWASSGDIDYELITATSEYANEPNLYGVELSNGEMRLDFSRTFPKTREELYQYDVMMISDIPVGNFSEEQMQWVVDWVIERGAGFLMAGGYRTFDVGHYDETPWEKIIPVDMLEYGEGFSEQLFTFKIPEAVKSHPLWSLDPDPEVNQAILDAHPKFTGMNRVRRAKPGALVLAERSDAPGEPVIAVQKYGRGRSVAFMPDLNGGWAKNYIGWGPEGGPVQGAHTELGHGASFKFNETAGKVPEGPAPPHPAPYYGRYWVNMVKWLGANSVRWRDDSLAGHVSEAHATAETELSVSAEVLAVIDPDQIPDLDVAARLDLPGSPRVRLEYDRDRREYLGQVMVPRGLEEDQVSVIFEANYLGQTVLDLVKVSVQKRNPEFLETNPDPEFMKQFVSTTGGRILNSPEEAIVFAKSVLEKREATRSDRRMIPDWVKWPVWGVFAFLLGMEWLLRRKGHRAVSVVVMMFFGLMRFPVMGQEERKPDPAVLIEQLGAERVRLRDDAEVALSRMPEAYDLVRAKIRETGNEELRLRAGQVVEALKKLRWRLVAELPSANVPGAPVRGLKMTADKSRAFVRCTKKVAIWDLEKQEAVGVIDQPTGMWGGWQDDGPAYFLDLAPDGRNLIVTDSVGGVFLYDVEKLEEPLILLKKPEVVDESGGVAVVPPVTAGAVLWCGRFFPESEKLMTGAGSGTIEIWDLERKALLESISTGPQGGGVFSFAISPDEETFIVSFDVGSANDYVWLWNFRKKAWVSKQQAPRISSFVFNKEGTKILAPARDGSLHYYDFREGNLSEPRIFHGLGTYAATAIFSADEKSAYVGLTSDKGEIVRVDLESGEILWRSDQLGSTVENLVLIREGRVLALHATGNLSIWQERDLENQSDE
ncbi:glutamine amidotransferase [Verrucomicrobiaceae bacterium 227]